MFFCKPSAIYFYWGAISGFKEQYFGMAFALYAVGTMISSPILAKWSQKVLNRLFIFNLFLLT